MRTRRLALRKETLVELSTAQLDSVAGGSGVSCSPKLCLPQSDLVQCVTYRCLETLACPTEVK